MGMARQVSLLVVVQIMQSEKSVFSASCSGLTRVLSLIFHSLTGRAEWRYLQQ